MQKEFSEFMKKKPRTNVKLENLAPEINLSYKNKEELVNQDNFY